MADKLTPQQALAVHNRGGKLLVVTGRPESAPETAQWLTEALGEASGAPTLWQVGPLSPDPELDVGVLSAAQLYDRELQSRCEEFLQQVRFVLLVEPSRLTAAGQIGLKLLLSRCGGGVPQSRRPAPRHLGPVLLRHGKCRPLPWSAPGHLPLRFPEGTG